MCVCDEEHLLDFKLLLVSNDVDSTSAWGWSYDEAVLAVLPLCREDNVGCFRHGTHGLDCPCIVALECSLIQVINWIIINIFFLVLFFILCELSSHKLSSEVVCRNRNLLPQITVEVVCVLAEADRALFHVHVKPIIFTQLSDFLGNGVA